MQSIVPKKNTGLAPTSIAEAMDLAKLLAESTIIPKEFMKSPGNIFVCIQWGMELGLQPLQAMQSIAVINGRPSLWGDAVIAIVRASPLCEFIYETDDGEIATCRVKRRGEEEQVRTFSTADAKTSGLSGKPGPWVQYPKRMRQMRARGFAMRDIFPDVLRGMPLAEELQDMGVSHAEDTLCIETIKEETDPAELPAYSDEKMAKNLPLWSQAIEKDRYGVSRLLCTLSSKYTLTEEQIEKINGLQVLELRHECA